MGRFVLRYFVAPTMLWLCPFFAGILIFRESSTAYYWLVGYLVAAPATIIAWWGISFSRWLHDRFYWDTIPYLIANVTTVIGIWGVAILLMMGLANADTDESSASYIFGVLTLFIGFFGGIGWFLRSLWKLFFNRQSKFQSLHWWLIEPDMTTLQGIQIGMPVSLPSLSAPGKTKRSAERPKRRTKSPESIFRSIAIDDTRTEEVRGIPIPKRVAPPQQQKTSGQRASTASRRDTNVFIPSFKVSVSLSSPRSSFVEQAKKHVNRTEQKAEHVPFMQYWPTYAVMSEAQQQWYFYWRTQLRQGNPLPADTSYLFVYVYEAINLVGFPSPEAAFKRLVSFWKHYRVLQPKLDNYLVDWLADFVVVYKLPTTPLNWYGVALQEGAFSGDIDLSIEAWLETGGDFHKLPSKLLYKLAGYTPTRSKFFKGHGEEYQLEKAYREGLQAIEQSLRDTGNSLFRIYRPAQARVIQRVPFANALHDVPQQTIAIGRVHPWTSREDLGNTLTSIIKYSENIKRTQAGFSSKLRGIDLPEEWESILDRTFTIPEPRREIKIDMDKVAQLQQESEEVRERLLVNDKPAPVSSVEQESTDQQIAISEIPEQPQREVAIDMDKVARLQSESESIRERLTAEGQEQASQSRLPESIGSMRSVEIAGSSSQPSYTQRPDDTPAELLTDLPEVAAVMDNVGQTASQLLCFLKENNWETNSQNVPFDLLEGSSLNTELDAINERAAQILGDALIFEENDQLVVAEDYRDELEFILEHPDYAETRVMPSEASASSETYSELTDDWATLAQRMRPHHWEALAALIGGIEVGVRLNAIARSAYTTANQLVDEINEFALDSIGDIVVDTEPDVPQIEEEDIEGIQALLAWASQKVLLEG